MKLVRLFYLLIAAMLIASSCSHTNEQLLRVEQLVETAPDSAMTILNKYSYNKLSDKDKALYGLLYIQIRDKKLLTLEPDSFLNFSLKYYQEKHDDHERLGTCYLYKGRCLRYQFQYEKAMDYYLKSLEFSTNNLVLGRVNFDIGYIYNLQRDHSLARKKFILSFRQFRASKSVSLAFNAILFIGRTYFEEKQYNKALTFYNRYKHNVLSNDEKDILWQEIALNHYKTKKYDSALFYLRETFKNKSLTNKSFRYLMMADLFFDINKTDSAEFYAISSLKDAVDIRTKKNCYRILVNCKTLQGDIHALNYYMSKYQDCNDSIRKIDSQTKGSYIETMHNTQKEVVKSRSWVWYLLAFIFIVVVISIWLYIRKHRKDLFVLKMVEEKQLVQKKESVQEIVERTKEALHKSLKEKRIELTKKIKQNTPEGRREMILQLYDESVHFKNKQHFKNEMDNTLNNLYSKLESGYPKLKTKEKQWACLNMLDIPNEDCMQLLDYNTEAFKKMKQRFAQKIGVDAVANIDAVLEKILYDAT